MRSDRTTRHILTLFLLLAMVAILSGLVMLVLMKSTMHDDYLTLATATDINSA